MPKSIAKVITELSDTDKPVLNSSLIELSDLSADELEVVKTSWAAIAPKRRRELVTRLVELTEDNFELDFTAIFKFCLKDPDFEIRCQAIEGLWENEDSSLIRPLITRLEQDNSEKVQSAAAIALGKFTLLIEHQKMRSSYTPAILSVLLRVVHDEKRSVEVRRRALEAMAPLSLPEVKETITQAYYGREPKLKISSIYSMGRNCGPSWLPMLINELRNSNAEIRYEAAVACGGLGEESVVPHLARLIDDPDSDVTLAAIQALGKIGGREAKLHLKRCLESSNKAVSQAAEAALGEIKAVEAPLSVQDWE